MEDVKNNVMALRWGSFWVTAVLGISLILSAFQTAQSASILRKVEQEGLKATGSNTPTLPSGLQNLPNMVGGC